MKRIQTAIASAALAAVTALGLGAGSAQAAATPSALMRVAQEHAGKSDGAHAGGVVASVSGTTITVSGRGGASKAIQTTGSTTFTLDGAASSLSAVTAGQFIW